MAQDPLQVDVLQVEPGSAGTRTIERDAATGSLKFTDAVATGGINLNELAGLRSIGNVYVVGKTGLGAEYTTIQAALDAVPSNSTEINPYLILVMPGVYVETVNIVRDGVYLVAVGRVVLRDVLFASPNDPGADHALIISAQLGTIPHFCYIEGFQIQVAHDNKACVRITGAAASQVGDTGIYLVNCDLRPTSPGGGRTVWANAVNNLYFRGGEWNGGTSDLAFFEECVTIEVDGVRRIGAVQLDYDDSDDLPSGAGVPTYEFRNCPDLLDGDSILVPPFSSTLEAVAAVTMRFVNCRVNDAMTWAGDSTFEAFNTTFLGLTISNTTTADLYNCRHGATNTNATAVLDEGSKSGTVLFAAATAAVVFDIPMSDALYAVNFEPDARPVSDETPWITNKLLTGFTINFQTAQTLNVA